jgi:hypothetical protein
MSTLSEVGQLLKFKTAANETGNKPKSGNIGYVTDESGKVANMGVAVGIRS